MFENFCKCRHENRGTSNCAQQFGIVEPFFCPRLNSVVLRGPRGLPGPRGPQGLPGVSAISNFGNFVSDAGQTVVASGTVNFDTIAILVGDAISPQQRTSGFGLVPGTYMICGNMSGYAVADCTVSFGLSVGKQSICFMTQSNVKASVPLCMGGNTIIRVEEDGVLFVVNQLAVPITVQNFSMSIVKLV